MIRKTQEMTKNGQKITTTETHEQKYRQNDHKEKKNEQKETCKVRLPLYPYFLNFHKWPKWDTNIHNINPERQKIRQKTKVTQNVQKTVDKLPKRDMESSSQKKEKWPKTDKSQTKINTKQTQRQPNDQKDTKTLKLGVLLTEMGGPLPVYAQVPIHALLFSKAQIPELNLFKLASKLSAFLYMKHTGLVSFWDFMTIKYEKTLLH